MSHPPARAAVIRSRIWEDLGCLAPVIHPRTFQVNDFDMHSSRAGNINGLFDRIHDPVRFIADVSEVGVFNFLSTAQSVLISSGPAKLPGGVNSPDDIPSAPARRPSSRRAIIWFSSMSVGAPIFESRHYKPERVVSHQHPGVDRDCGKRVEVFRKGHFADRQPRRPAAQVGREKLRLSRQHRCDRETTMSDDFGRDPLPDLALSLWINGEDKIGMSFDVDEAWRHREPG
jgi:hypothetical protein